MTDVEFLHRLDKIFEKIQQDDIRGNDLFDNVSELNDLCEMYLQSRIHQFF